MTIKSTLDKIKETKRGVQFSNECERKTKNECSGEIQSDAFDIVPAGVGMLDYI